MKDNLDDLYVDNIIDNDVNDIPQPSGKKDIYNIPTSVPGYIIYRTLVAGKSGLEKIRTRNKSKPPYEIQINTYDEKMRLVHYGSSNADISISIDDINLFSGSNKGIIKLFVFILQQFNKKCVVDGKIKDYTVEFTLKSIQDAGLYSSVQGARRGLKNAIDVLQSYKLVSEYIKYGSNIESNDDDIDSIVIFTRIRIHDGKCTVTLNSAAGEDFFIKYFTILPVYCFSLPINAFNILYYIFYKARIHSDTIKNKGSLNINLRELSNFLVLPNEKETKSIKDKTLSPIISSVKDIIDAHNEYYSGNNNEIDLELIYPDTEKPKTTEILDDGYLKITLSGRYLESFKNISERKTKKIEQSKKRRQKSIEAKSSNSEI